MFYNSFHLQNEWDEVMLETFTLKQQLDTTRQELSQALYQNDAACRVIARLMRERDEARATVEHISTNIVPATKTITSSNGASASEATSTDNHVSATATVPAESSTTTVNGINETVIATLNDKCKELSVTRKSRKPQPEGLLSIDSISSLSESVAFTPHTTAKGGVTALAVSQSVSDPAGAYVLSGGVDKVAVISNKEGNVLGKLSGHTKKITDVSFHVSDGLSGPFFTASADKTVKVIQ